MSSDPTGDPGQRFSAEDETLIEGDAWAFNNAPWDQQKLVTVGNYQYAPYWDGDGALSLARRNLVAGSVQTVTFDWTVPDEDSHRNTAIGADRDGRLHLAYDHHDDPFHYRYSDAGFLTDPPASVSTSDFSDDTDMGLAGPEEPVTYPRFFTDEDGALYCAYRLGSSGDGDTYLHSHESSANDWTRVGMVFSRDGTYAPWNDSTSRNAYCHDWTFDGDGRLHVTWTWRETWETWASNHDLHYAYSDDRGVTWRDDDGDQIADLSSGDPISVDDRSAVVVEAPVHSWLINQGTQALDADGQPHVFTSRSTVVTSDYDDANRHYVHYWRTSDGQWHQRYVDDASVDLADDAEIESTRDAAALLDRGDLLFDLDGDLHVYAGVDGRLYGGVATAASGWTDWTVYLLDAGPIRGMDGRKHDETRWRRDGVLSVPLERPNGGGSTAFVVRDYALAPVSPPERPDPSATRPSPSRVELRWPGAERATSYAVSRRPADEDCDFDAVADDVGSNSFVTSYADTDVTPGTDYEYRVTARNRAGETESAVVEAPNGKIS